MSRTVIVIGGTTGIGRAIAEGFAAQGDAVTATGHELPGDSAGGISFAQLDVREGAGVEAFFAGFERIDVLVNAAGIIRRGGAEFTPEGFAEVVDVNLNGSQRCCAAAHEALKRAGGCVINTASMLTYFGSATSPAYAASKGGIGQLTKSLAVAWAADGIRVNAIAPGWIATALTQALGENEERSAAIIGRTPMRRWGQPSDLVGPALFLASDAAGFVTGAILPVDGGFASA
ncbi:SDR family NAD(P)-dependent oxidoreductase [Halovulum sp. GXIMD14794]